MFIVKKRAVDDVEPFVYLPGADGLAVGMAANLTAGALAKATATVKPTHIVQGPKNRNGLYPAIQVVPTTIFEVPTSAVVASSKIGNKVTINTDALSVTATDTSGVFKVLTVIDDSTVTGYFE